MGRSVSVSMIRFPRWLPVLLFGFHGLTSHAAEVIRVRADPSYATAKVEGRIGRWQRDFARFGAQWDTTRQPNTDRGNVAGRSPAAATTPGYC